MVYKYLKLLLCAVASVSSTPLSFISYGDWGSSNYNQEMVAYNIAQYTDKYNSSFNLVLGNNFYENGVTSTQDKLWQTNYEYIYTNNNPWYVTLGTHDYHGNTSAQIAYTGLDGRWNMPDYNYVINKGYLKIIMLDTQQLAPECSQLPSNTTSKLKKQYIYKWLINELRSSNQIKIVVGHSGIYSTGEYGNCNELIANLFPILTSYKVVLYLHSHSHLFELNNYKSLDMIGCGTASELSKYQDLRFKYSNNKYYSLNYGFCLHSLYNEKNDYYILTRFVNQNGDVLFQHKSDGLAYLKDNGPSVMGSLFKWFFLTGFLGFILYCCYAAYLAYIYTQPHNELFNQSYNPGYIHEYAPRYDPNVLGSKNPQQNPLLNSDKDIL